MPDYYDSWSASKKKKNPNRQHTRESSARSRQPHHSALDSSPSSLAFELITSSPHVAPTTSFSHQPTTPPYQQSTANSLSTSTGSYSTVSHPILNPQIAVQGWRFSKNFFDSKKSVSYEADFDDVDDEDDDEDLDYDDVGIDNGKTTNDITSDQPSSIHSVPRLPSVAPRGHCLSGSTTQPASRRSMFWPDFQSKKSTPVQRERDLGHIEQLDNRREDDDASLFPDVLLPGLLAQSLPALPNTDVTSLTSDHPLSTSTFNARLYPPAIPEQDSSVSARRGSRRPRPWSQVIWESPVLDGSLEHTQQPSQQTSKVEYINSLTVDARLGGVYPALTKDLFTQDPTAAKERVAGKSVRIQIDTDMGSQSSSRPTQSKLHSSSGVRSISGGNSNLRGNLHIHNNLLPVVSGKRELSHSKKNNRLSLGSGFYASIEPVFLSNATPSTPKTKRNLVRLPARPQSVLIPAGAVTSHLGSSQVGTKISGPTLQPVSVESSKRRRHQSQQLELRGEPLSVPIPWKHLSTLSANNNARTFHGLGSIPSAPLPVLKKGGFQSTALDGSTSCSALADTVAEKAASNNLPVREQTPSPKQVSRRNHGSHTHTHSHTHYRQTSFSPPSNSFLNNRQSTYTPSKFLPALLESSSSFFFKKPRPAFAISSRSSSRNSTISDMSDSTSSSSTSSPSKAQGRTKTSPPSSSSSPFRHTLQFHPRKPVLSHALPRSRQTLMASPSPSTYFAASATAAASTQLTTSNSLPATSMTTSATTTTTTTSSWKRDSSSILFPYSLVSYEIGGVVGGHSRNITHASSSGLAPGTTLPSGIIVSTEVPPSLLSPDSAAPAVPTISLTPSESSGGISHPQAELESYNASNDGEDALEGEDDNKEEEEDDEEYEGDEHFVAGEEYGSESKGSSQYMHKSHVAVYEINARWGSRLMMVLVTIGGLVSVLGGGLCAEHHCRDLQFCQDSYQAHGNWCGPSGVDGAPYMLTVGLSMCIFGLYSLTYLRIPTSRLVGYSEIDQFL